MIMKKRNNIRLRIILVSAIIISVFRLSFLFTKIDIGLFMDIILFLSACTTTYLLYRSKTQMNFVSLIINSLILTILSIIIFEFSRGMIIEMPISFAQMLNRIFVSVNVILIFSTGNLITALLCKIKLKSDNDLIDQL